MNKNYSEINPSKGLIKAWIHGVPFEEEARQQVMNVASLPFVTPHVAVMPDAHWGLGSTIGSVIPTQKAIIPASVGVDLGCGMMAVQTSLMANDLPDNLLSLRRAIEEKVPHGRTQSGRKSDRGAWGRVPKEVLREWGKLDRGFQKICETHPEIGKSNHITHLGTLGTGNHFIEVSLDETQQVWIMLHSGSRGVGNKIGRTFIELAKKEMERLSIHLPDKNLAYLQEGARHFEAYMHAVDWAQQFAATNRRIMMSRIVTALKELRHLPPFHLTEVAVNCHHNYVAKERHFNQDLWITRKGAVRAQEGELGIIPGSMGAKSYIVRGKGNAQSFCSCSHGAGRVMSRTQAKKQFTIQDHIKATQGVECRKDGKVIDETPMAYKSIEAVMAAQQDLVDIVYTLKQVVCVKG